MSEIDSVFRDYRRGKSNQYAHYNASAHNSNQDSFLGYVADVTPENRIYNKYTVSIPELQNAMLRSIPRVVPDGFSQANGVGRSASPLRPGQPVIVRFLKGRSSLPYIDGSINLNGVEGAIEDYEIPSIDQQDYENGLTLWPTPITPETLAAKGDAETTVWPIIPRSQAPNQGTNTGTCLEIPGNTEVRDYQGNVFTSCVGQTISSDSNEITRTEGVRSSMADQPIIKAIEEANRVQAEITEELAYWRSMLNGSYQIVKPHPAGNKTDGLIFTPNGNTLLSGGLTIPTGLSIASMPGSKEVDGFLARADIASRFISEASKISGLQLDFLQEKLGSVVAVVKKVWGSFERFGTVGLSIDIPLPLNLEISLSISFDFTTGEISITGALGFGSGLKPGTMLPKQALPLSAERGFTVGAPPRVKRPKYILKEEVVDITTTTIYTKYPELKGYAPIQESKRIPFVLVSRDLNNLDFSTNPEEGVASILTSLGVNDSAYVIKYLVSFIDYGDIFSFLGIFSTLATKPKDKVVLSYISDSIGGGSSGDTNAVETQIEQIEKPALDLCPPIPSAVYQIAEFTRQGKTTESKELVESFFLEELPQIDRWVENIDELIDWIKDKGQDYPYFPAMKRLSEGDVIGFLVLTVFITSGIDIEAYDKTYQQLKAYTDMSFFRPALGVL